MKTKRHHSPATSVDSNHTMKAPKEPSGWIVPVSKFHLGMLCTLLVLVGCDSPKVVQKPPPSITEADVLKEEKNRAIAAAKEEAVRRGWRDFVV